MNRTPFLLALVLASGVPVMAVGQDDLVGRLRILPEMTVGLTTQESVRSVEVSAGLVLNPWVRSWISGAKLFTEIFCPGPAPRSCRLPDWSASAGIDVGHASRLFSPFVGLNIGAVRMTSGAWGGLWLVRSGIELNARPNFVPRVEVRYERVDGDRDLVMGFGVQVALRKWRSS